MFNLYKYLQGNWYFWAGPNTAPSSTPAISPPPNGPVYFPDYTTLSPAQQQALGFDTGYQTFAAQMWDAAFLAWQAGFMQPSPQGPAKPLAMGPVTHAFDNYRFIYKYYGKRMATMCLLGQLATRSFLAKQAPPPAVRVPLWKALGTEIKAWYKARKTPFTGLKPPTLQHTQQAIQALPAPQNLSISVILPTLNRPKLLQQALQCLEQQSLPPTQVLVIDGAANPNAAFYQQFNLPIEVLHDQAQGLSTARNMALEKCTGQLIVFYEDDVLVPPHWLLSHWQTLTYYQAHISTGLFYPPQTAPPPHRRHFKYADQIATNNTAIWASAMQQLQGFDLAYNLDCWEDADLGMRAYLAGMYNVANPLAQCVDLKPPYGGLRFQGHTARPGHSLFF